MNDLPQPQRRTIALRILAQSDRLSRRAGQFLGGCVVDDAPMSEKQLDWFLTLAESAGVEVSDHA